MRVQASSSVNLGDRKAGEAEEVAQSWFGACTSHRTGDLGLQFPGPAPRRMPHVFSRSPAHLPLPETPEGGEEHVLPTRGTEHTAKPPPGVPARPSAWLRTREAGVCHVPGTADQLDCCVLFCEAFPAPLCVTWYLHDTTSAHCRETSQPAPTPGSGSASHSSLSPCPQPRA